MREADVLVDMRYSRLADRRTVVCREVLVSCCGSYAEVDVVE